MHEDSSAGVYSKHFCFILQKIGVKLHPYEIDALANSISGKGYNKNVINYRYGYKLEVLQD